MVFGRPTSRADTGNAFRAIYAANGPPSNEAVAGSDSSSAPSSDGADVVADAAFAPPRCCVRRRPWVRAQVVSRADRPHCHERRHDCVLQLISDQHQSRQRVTAITITGGKAAGVTEAAVMLEVGMRWFATFKDDQPERARAVFPGGCLPRFLGPAR